MDIKRVVSEYLNDTIVRTYKNLSVDKAEAAEHVNKIDEYLETGVKSKKEKTEIKSQKSIEVDERAKVQDRKDSTAVLEKKNTDVSHKLTKIKDSINLSGKFKLNINILKTLETELANGRKLKFLYPEEGHIYENEVIELVLNDQQLLNIKDFKFEIPKEILMEFIILDDKNSVKNNLGNSKTISRFSLKLINETDISKEEIIGLVKEKLANLFNKSLKSSGLHYNKNLLKNDIDIIIILRKGDGKGILLNGRSVNRDENLLEYISKGSTANLQHNIPKQDIYKGSHHVTLEVHFKDNINNSYLIGLSQGTIAFLDDNAIKKIKGIDNNYQSSSLSGVPYVLKMIQKQSLNLQSKKYIVALILLTIIFIFAFFFIK
ncbi:hypothetical protein [Alkalibacter mobilis]|uniref:hypothetical protein n=1 Tax=Alkalibacter mobilis TaxID=2787712 RepID=UPI00189F7368|nr:hypothetical protein [Alkalibacter mobilis]MBF7097523.1 hypothetical protein [Alkalibacter mobilis]